MTARSVTPSTSVPRRREESSRPRTYRGLARPPGPRNLPVVGGAFDFRGDPLAAIARYAARYGDVVFLDIVGSHTYLLSHPDDIAALLVGAHAKVMKDEPTHDLSRFVGRGLLTSEGRLWKRQRKIAAPSFQRTQIGKFADAMVDATWNRIPGLRRGGVHDVHTDMMVVTLEIVLRTMFGEATLPDIDQVGEIVETLMMGFADNYLTWRRIVPRALRPQAHAKLDEATAKLDEILYGLIRGRRQAGGGGDDLLGHLLAARDDDGVGMSDRQLRDEVATVFLAGHETTALALSYALWLLARSPHVQRRLHAEVDAALGSTRATLDDLPELPLCDAVIKESMRLYPPAYLVGREPLEDIEIAGWTLPRGSQVLCAQWVVHRDARWYPDPLTFDPDRWLDGRADALPRFAYFPFGGGSRICVGNHFAMLEAALVLATLMQHLSVAPDPTHELGLMATVTLRPKDGVRLQVQPR